MERIINRSDLRYRLFFLAAFVLVLIGGCTATSANGNTTTKNESNCSWNELERSQEIIKYILQDLTDNYGWVSGGGIQRIKQLASNSYVVSINQEERTDEITYELTISSTCEISVISRIESAITR